MSKGFEYNASSRVTIARAKKARNIILLVKGLQWLVPIGAYVAMWIFTPWQIGLVVTIVCVFIGLMYLVIEKGDSIAYAYEKLKDDFDYAKSMGVKDE